MYLGHLIASRLLKNIFKKKDSFCLSTAPLHVSCSNLSWPALKKEKKKQENLFCQPRDELLSFWRSGGSVSSKEEECLHMRKCWAAELYGLLDARRKVGPFPRKPALERWDLFKPSPKCLDLKRSVRRSFHQRWWREPNTSRFMLVWAPLLGHLDAPVPQRQANRGPGATCGPGNYVIQPAEPSQ